MEIGILALQGSYEKHRQAMEKLGVNTRLIRYARELEDTDGLIIPGGESTTMSRVIERNSLFPILNEYKKPIFGTCAGAILLSSKVGDPRIRTLGKIPVKILRNAFGRQVESFVENLSLSFSRDSFRGVFIRAPRFGELNSGVTVLARLYKEPVMIQYGKFLAATFHPELVDDSRIHAYFLEICKSHT